MTPLVIGNGDIVADNENAFGSLQAIRNGCVTDRIGVADVR